MATTMTRYPSRDDAQHALQAQHEHNGAAAQIWLISGSLLHDGNHERVGSFADGGPHEHNARQERVGSFADMNGALHDGNHERVGSFADVWPAAHDTRQERVGSFADVERVTLMRWEAGRLRARTAGDRELEALFRQVGVEPAEAAAGIAAVHSGQVLLLTISAADTRPERALEVGTPAPPAR